MRCLAAAALTSAAVMRAIGCHAAVFTALGCLAASIAATALVGAVTAVPLRAIGAASAAIALALVEVSAPASIVLARLSATTGEPPVSPDNLSSNAIRAQMWLTSLIVAFSASAALGAIGAAVGPYPTGGPPCPALRSPP